MQRKPPALRERAAGLLAGLFAERGVTDLVRREVDALTPGNPGWELVQAKPSRSTLTRILLVLTLITVPTVLLATLGYDYPAPEPVATCTFPSGTVVEGDCMFEDTFSTALDTSVWLAADDWSGPLQQVIPDVGCFRHENVSTSGGNLVLRMSVNARGSCPQTWAITPYYTSNYGADWTPGATSYDVGVVDMKPGSFKMKYGTVEMRITLPPGRGPGGDVTLWGADCQNAIGSVGALSDLFTFADGQRACDWPNIGSGEMDIIQSSRTGATTIVNTSTYTAEHPGSPSSQGTFSGIPFWGERWAQPLTGGFTPFLATVANPTTSFHVYRLEWTPTRWAVFADNLIVAYENPDSPTWILDHDAYMMIWNAATVPVTDADLPSDMLVDYVRIWCPPGVPCEWSGTAAL